LVAAGAVAAGATLRPHPPQNFALAEIALPQSVQCIPHLRFGAATITNIFRGASVE
jgi:hypothetical protein